MHSSLPARDVVLLGVGHTNAHVLRMWRMHPLPGARLTCVSNFPTSTYSGMLPGVLAGQYPADRMEIDLVRLCSAAGARLVVAHIIGLDRERRELLFDDRPPLPFDVLSIGIGSAPKCDGAGTTNAAVVTIKPMQTFLRRLEKRIDELVQRTAPLRIAVVGGGAGGVEVVFCLGPRLRMLLNHAPYQLTLISAIDPLIGGVTAKTSEVARRELERRGIELIIGERVTQVTAEGLTLGDGRELRADVVIWATNATGPPLLHKLGFETDEQGFLLTRPTLQTLSDEAVFAVGDAGTIRGVTIPKAGVYAVRQGPVLTKNIERLLAGEPLEEFCPQRNFLKLFNTGDGQAIAEYMGLTYFGTWAWRLKDWIDGRFMDMYQNYEPAMSAPADRASARSDGQPNRAVHAITAQAGNPSTGDRSTGNRSTGDSMLCYGCGGKIGGEVLSRALARLDVPTSPHVVLGLETPDDAAVVRVPSGGTINLSVDFFTAPLDDPFLVGRIAALNAASDCYATGAQPIAALALATLPDGPEDKQEQLLFELLSGALHEFRPMGATLAGGHTIEGSPTTIGFSMVAAQNAPPRTKGQLRAGDSLILTKPLGIGVLLAAHRRARCHAAWWEPLFHTMLLSNQYAATLCEEFDIAGLTDVTGFGLAGHLMEMLHASQVAAEIQLDRVELLTGAVELIGQGIESTLVPANRRAETEMGVTESQRNKPQYAALFDPQTNGGLLMGVAKRHVRCVLERLAQQSAVAPMCIGHIVDYRSDAPRLRIV